MKEPKRDITKMVKAFDEIQMARPPYVLEKMVVGSKFTEEQRYAQCTLELSIAYDALRTAELMVEKKEIEIKEVKTKGRKGEIKKELLQIEQEQTRRAMIGKMREFECLYVLWCKFPKKFTREEMNAAQPAEFKAKLELQASQDKNATGRVSVGNQEGLRQIGKSIYPELDVARDTERRFLETGKQRILIGVPTEHKAEKGLPCLEGLDFPTGAEIRLYNSWGRKVAESYNHIVETALADKADYIITVEDDTFPQPDALVKLMKLLKENPKSAVAAWYPKKEKSRQGVHIILKDKERTEMKDDGTIQEAYTMAMGCSIYPIEMFMKIPFPWFKTTDHLSQDSFFSQLAREAGYKLLVDTSIKCKHIDRKTGKVFK